MSIMHDAMKVIISYYSEYVQKLKFPDIFIAIRRVWFLPIQFYQVYRPCIELYGFTWV
jgi:hypothetical protein